MVDDLKNHLYISYLLQWLLPFVKGRIRPNECHNNILSDLLSAFGLKSIRAVRLHQAWTLAFIHRFNIFGICSFLTLRITAIAEGYRHGGPFCFSIEREAVSAMRCHLRKKARIACRSLVLVHSSCLWHRPLVAHLCEHCEVWTCHDWFFDCIHSLAPDILHRTLSPCLRVLTRFSSRQLLPPCIHSPALPHENNRDLSALSYTSYCRHFPIARCTFSPFNKISTTVASLFFLCKDSPARALQVPVAAPYPCTKFKHAFRIFFFTPGSG